MQFTTLDIDIRKHVLFCRLNRAEKRNALNETMLRELLSLFDFMKTGERDIRILVLSGTGKVFSAGADLSMMSDINSKTRQDLLEEAGLFFDCFDALYRLPIPTICYVHGGVHGGANGLLASCDFTIAEKNTRFSFGELKLGLIPATVAPFVLKRSGIIHAKKMMLSANSFNAADGVTYGLVDSLCSDIDSDKLIEEQINVLLDNAPEAMRKTKNLLLKLDNFSNSENLKDFCTGVIADARLSDEAREGINSFFEKRDPQWK